MTERPLVAIIGAGPGGTTTAAMLKKLGVESVIIERTTFPRFMIGESLLPISLDHFEEAGLLDAIEKADFVRKPGAVFHNGKKLSRRDFKDTSNINHDHSFSLKRAPFDKLLADEVEKKGIEIRWNTSVEKAARKDGKWALTLKTKAGETSELQADFVVDSSGSALIPRQLGVGIAPTDPALFRGGVFAHIEDPNRPEGFDGNATWVVTNDTSNGWTWIIPFSDGTASVGFVDLEGKIKSAGETDEERFNALLKTYPVAFERFSNSKKTRDPESFFRYRRAVIPPAGDGYCLLGNSIGFLDPVFSSGIAIVTETAIRAAHGIKKTFEDPTYDWEKNYSEPLLDGVRVFSDCVNRWYDGMLPALIHNAPTNEDGTPHRIGTQITSLLAGSAWDKSNSLTENTAFKIEFLNKENSK